MNVNCTDSFKELLRLVQKTLDMLILLPLCYVVACKLLYSVSPGMSCAASVKSTEPYAVTETTSASFSSKHSGGLDDPSSLQQIVMSSCSCWWNCTPSFCDESQVLLLCNTEFIVLACPACLVVVLFVVWYLLFVACCWCFFHAHPRISCGSI